MIWRVALAVVLMAVSSTAYAQRVRLESGASVILRSGSAIDGSAVTVGEEINFEVIEDVVVVDPMTSREIVVIRAGTGARATIQQQEESGSLGEGGRLTISVDSTSGVDGSRVDLAGTIYFKGDDNTGSTIALGVILCPLFLLMEGDDAILPAGYETRARTVGTHYINVGPAINPLFEGPGAMSDPAMPPAMTPESSSSQLPTAAQPGNS